MDLRDIPIYKKKSNKKPPKKANHKHKFESCVFITPVLKHDKAHGFVYDDGISIGTYCVICGKIGTTNDYKRWKHTSKQEVGIEHPHSVYRVEYSDAAMLELDEHTRTLPTFRLKELYGWDRFIEPDDAQIKEDNE